MFDSVMALAHGLAALDRGTALKIANLSCDAEQPWNDGSSLFNYINSVEEQPRHSQHTRLRLFDALSVRKMALLSQSNVMWLFIIHVGFWIMTSRGSWVILFYIKIKLEILWCISKLEPWLIAKQYQTGSTETLPQPPLNHDWKIFHHLRTKCLFTLDYLRTIFEPFNNILRII